MDDTVVVRDSENVGVRADRMRKEKVVNGDCNSMMPSPKKILADITNLQYPCSKLSNQWEKHQNPSFVPKDYLALVKENAILKKFMAQVQGGKLKVELEKLRKQNSDLARANHVLLTELNSCKDRLKELQHELGCKNGVVMAIKQQLQEKTTTVTSAFEVAASYKEEGTKGTNACKISQTNNVDDELCSSKRKMLFKPRSLPTADEQSHDEAKSSNNRIMRDRYTGNKSESIPILNGAAGTEENEERCNAMSRNSPTLFNECETSKVDTAEDTLCGAKKKRRVSKPLSFEPTGSEQANARDRVGNKRRIRQSTTCKSVRGSIRATVDEENEECSTGGTVDDKLCNVKRKRLSNLLLSMGTSSEESWSQEEAVNRRRSKRLSKVCKSESDPASLNETVSESNVERFDGSNSNSQRSSSGVRAEETGKLATAAKLDESRTSIIGRPSRRAADKVQSYKEISLKIKMRRPE